MIGVIQVGEPVNINEIKEASKSLKSSFVMNTERIENYLNHYKENDDIFILSNPCLAK